MMVCNVCQVRIGGRIKGRVINGKVALAICAGCDPFNNNETRKGGENVTKIIKIYVGRHKDDNLYVYYEKEMIGDEPKFIRIDKIPSSVEDFLKMKKAAQIEMCPPLHYLLKKVTAIYSQDPVDLKTRDCKSLIRYSFAEEDEGTKINEQEDNNMSSESKLNNKEAKKVKAAKGGAAVAATVEKKGKPAETKTEKPAKAVKAVKAPKEDKGPKPLFKEGSKYANVFRLLNEGITFKELQAKLEKAYGSPTSDPGNVRIFIATISKKERVKFDKDEKTGIMMATEKK